VVESDGASIGRVTSGNFSPVLGTGIALALIDEAAGLKEGEKVTVRIGDSELPVIVGKAPFVKNGKPVGQLAPS
jgi:aminomethyltransferase